MNIDSTALVDDLRGETLEDLTRDFARRWFELCQDKLLARGEQIGYEVHSVVQSGQPVHWDDGEGAWMFSFDHIAAEFLEVGTEPHTITPDSADMLKFPWPGAPEGLKERFRPKWSDPSHWLEKPEVLLPKVEHPGTPALHYASDSRDIVAQEMEAPPE